MKLDPVFLNTRREAVVVLLVWAASLIWTVGYSVAAGYGDSETVEIVLGLPSWVVYGLALPWGLAGAFTVVFAIKHVSDDDLGGEGPPHE